MERERERERERDGTRGSVPLGTDAKKDRDGAEGGGGPLHLLRAQSASGGACQC